MPFGPVPLECPLDQVETAVSVEARPWPAPGIFVGCPEEKVLSERRNRQHKRIADLNVAEIHRIECSCKRSKSFTEARFPKQKGAGARPSLCAAPSPGTPGEGRGEGDSSVRSRWRIRRWVVADTRLLLRSKSPSPQPSPGIPGEGAPQRRSRALLLLPHHAIGAPDKSLRRAPCRRISALSA